jgi:hypothetical protein
MLGAKSVTFSLALIAILAIFGLILVGLSQRLPSQEQQGQNQHQPNNQNTSADEKVTSEEKYQASGWAKIKQAIERNEKVVTALSTAVIAAFTVALVLATGFLYFSSEKVADAAKDSAEVARAALVVANRPWITVEASIERSLTQYSGFITQMKLVLNNTGHSPALRVQIGAETLYGPTDRLVERDKILAKQRADKTQSGLVVHPGVPFTRVVGAQTPVDFLKARLKEGNDHWMQTIVVCVTYDFEATGKTYATSFIVQTGGVQINEDSFKSTHMVPEGQGLVLMRLERYEFAD